MSKKFFLELFLKNFEGLKITIVILLKPTTNKKRQNLKRRSLKFQNPKKQKRSAQVKQNFPRITQ